MLSQRGFFKNLNTGKTNVGEHIESLLVITYLTNFEFIYVKICEPNFFDLLLIGYKIRNTKVNTAIN